MPLLLSIHNTDKSDKKKVQPKRSLYQRRKKSYSSTGGSKITRWKAPRDVTIIPDIMYTKVVYPNATNYTRNGFGVVNWSFQTDLYTPDGGINLNPPMVGITELNTMYQHYRICAFAWDWVVSNTEAFSVTVSVFPSQQKVPATLGTVAVAYPYLGNPFNKWDSLAASGGMDKAMFKGYITLKKLVGDSYILKDDLYTGALPAGASPALLCFLNFIVASNGGSLTAKGVGQTLKLTYYVKVFDRFVLAS